MLRMQIWCCQPLYGTDTSYRNLEPDRGGALFYADVVRLRINMSVEELPEYHFSIHHAFFIGMYLNPSLDRREFK